ncbi:MAG: ribosome silencing factor [Thermodesulfobacteriota bacterium]
MKKIAKNLARLSSLELAQVAAHAALDKKAENLVILDVQGLASFTDAFVIMSGRSTRHVQGLAQAVDDALASKRLKTTNTEGLTEGHWVLLDYGEIVVHVFYSDTREFYDLEGLWHDAPRVPVTETPPAHPGED